VHIAPSEAGLQSHLCFYFWDCYTCKTLCRSCVAPSYRNIRVQDSAFYWHIAAHLWISLQWQSQDAPSIGTLHTSSYFLA